MLQGLGGILFCLAILAGIVLGGWQMGWWFKSHNTDRQAHVNRQSYGFQQATREHITQLFRDVSDIDVQLAQMPDNADQLAAQQKAIKDQICQAAEQITGDPLPADQGDWVHDHCAMGASK